MQTPSFGEAESTMQPAHPPHLHPVVRPDPRLAQPPSLGARLLGAAITTHAAVRWAIGLLLLLLTLIVSALALYSTWRAAWHVKELVDRVMQ